MFGKMMYYDKKTIDEYKAIITGKKPLEIEEYEQTKSISAGVDLKAIGADAKTSKSYRAKATPSLIYECFEFEKALKNQEDYFDFTQSYDYDLSTAPRGSIIKAEAFMEIPEGFDFMKVIDSYKSILLDSPQVAQMEKSGQDLLKASLSDNKMLKIPVICDMDGFLLCSKIYQDYMTIDYSEFEELDEQVTVLARLSSDNVPQNKPFYDPLKDFLTLNRMLRRKVKERNEELKALFVDREYRQIDILAIYR